MKFADTASGIAQLFGVPYSNNASTVKSFISNYTGDELHNFWTRMDGLGEDTSSTYRHVYELWNQPDFLLYLAKGLLSLSLTTACGIEPVMTDDFLNFCGDVRYFIKGLFFAIK